MSYHRNERFKPSEHGEINAVPHTRAILPAADQTGFFEYPQVFGNGGLGKGQLANNLTAHARFLPRQQSKNSNSRRVPDSFGEHR
jgi:hypothetical protein